MDDYITRKEHEEFARRIDEENTRQNKRLTSLEDTVKQIQELTVSVKGMAISLEHMANELKNQGDRLSAIEKEPAQKWKNAVWLVIAAIIGAVITFLLSRIGL